MRSALLFSMLLAAPAMCQQPEEEHQPARLPSGRLQMDEILKSDHERALREVDQIMKLAAELKDDLQKSGQYVYSLSAEKKAAEIEKLAKRIRASIRRH
jgi:hypothetical protein